jgi:hypothetical protein
MSVFFRAKLADFVKIQGQSEQSAKWTWSFGICTLSWVYPSVAVVFSLIIFFNEHVYGCFSWTLNYLYEKSYPRHLNISRVSAEKCWTLQLTWWWNDYFDECMDPPADRGATRATSPPTSNRAPTRGPTPTCRRPSTPAPTRSATPHPHPMKGHAYFITRFTVGLLYRLFLTIIADTKSYTVKKAWLIQHKFTPVAEWP